MKKFSMLIAITAFFTVSAFANTSVSNPIVVKDKKEATTVPVKVQATEISVTMNENGGKAELFPLSIQASCATFTFEYTCPGCTWAQIQSDIQILTAWSELTCMVFF